MLSAIMKIKNLWSKFSEKEFRDAYSSHKIASDLSAQIYALREARNWTQYDLADRVGMKQPRISILENSCDNVSVETLRRVASALDVALSIKFVPFSQIVHDAATERLDRKIPSFSEDLSPINGSFKVNGSIDSGKSVGFLVVTQQSNHGARTRDFFANVSSSSRRIERKVYA